MTRGPATGHQATIKGEDGRQILLTLHADGDAYRWYDGDEDVELSGETYEAAGDALCAAYGMHHWELDIVDTVRAVVYEALHSDLLVTAYPSGLPLTADDWRESLAGFDEVADWGDAPKDAMICITSAATPPDWRAYEPMTAITGPNGDCTYYVVWRPRS